MNTSIGVEPNQVKKELSWSEKELREFKETVLKDKQLKCCRTDDIFLLSFLRAKKYDREKALKLLKNYYQTRKKYTDVFQNLRPSTMERFLQMDMMTTTRVEPDVVFGYGRVSHWNADEVSAIDVARCILLLLDLELNDHPLQVNGFTAFIDVKTLSWKHFIQFTPRMIYLVISCFHQSIPLCYKAIHIVNSNKLLSGILAMLFPFLPYKFKQRIHIHGSNMETLHKEFDPKYLPAEFGGQLPSFDCTEFKQRLRENEQLFIENEKYWTEDKRT